jgi:hypothetical protein
MTSFTTHKEESSWRTRRLGSGVLGDDLDFRFCLMVDN